MQGFDRTLLERLTQIGRVSVYEAGSIIFYEGEAAHSLCVLRAGKVRLYKSGELGAMERTIHTLQAPTLLAEMPFFTQGIYPASAEAVEKSEILCISQESFREHILGDSEVCLLFIASLCQKIRILESHIASQDSSLEKRLLHFIESHAQNLPSLTQRAIAKAINTTPESLSRTLKSLKAQHIITTHKGRITLLQPPKPL